MDCCRIRANLYLVSLSFLLNMSAYFSLEGLQSSLHDEAGTASLSALYSAFVVTSLFLPSLVLNFLQSRMATACATVPYAIYTIANFYPHSYTLIPAAAILGSGSSVLWSSSRLYISNLAIARAQQSKHGDKDKTTAEFFSIFYSIFSLSILIGNAASATAIQIQSRYDREPSDSFGLKTDKNYSLPYVTTILPTTLAIASTKNTTLTALKCAMHDCDNLTNISAEIPSQELNKQPAINDSVLNTLLGLFVGMQLSAALVLFIFATDAPKLQDKVSVLKLEEEANADESENQNHTSGNASVLELRAEEAHNVGSKHTDINANSNCKKSTMPTVLHKALATGRFIIFNHNSKLLIPLTLHVGVLQAFLFGQFTKHWVTCVLGIEYVGYAVAVLGLGSAVGGYVTGLLARVLKKEIISIGTLILELLFGIWLFIWEPEIVDAVWVFLITSFVCGVMYATNKILLNTVYTIFFPDDKEAASSTLAIWDPLGTSVAYAVSTQICNRLFLIIMLSLATVGTILFGVAEFLYKREQKKKKLPLEMDETETKTCL